MLDEGRKSAIGWLLLLLGDNFAVCWWQPHKAGNSKKREKETNVAMQCHLIIEFYGAIIKTFYKIFTRRCSRYIYFNDISSNKNLILRAHVPEQSLLLVTSSYNNYNTNFIYIPKNLQTSKGYLQKIYIIPLPPTHPPLQRCLPDNQVQKQLNLDSSLEKKKKSFTFLSHNWWFFFFHKHFPQEVVKIAYMDSPPPPPAVCGVDLLLS